jgi:hypothetical protein
MGKVCAIYSLNVFISLFSKSELINHCYFFFVVNGLLFTFANWVPFTPLIVIQLFDGAPQVWVKCSVAQ